MKVIDVKDYDICNYKKPSMFIIMPYCSFKCDKENGCQLCQNSALAKYNKIDISIDKLIDMYDKNTLVKSIVFGGLEPFDSAEDLNCFIMNFRQYHADTIVIYTGYTEQEVHEKFSWIFLYENIIIKYGRFRPNQNRHYDELLGVYLASDNQYAKAYNIIDESYIN